MGEKTPKATGALQTAIFTCRNISKCQLFTSKSAHRSLQSITQISTGSYNEASPRNRLPLEPQNPKLKNNQSFHKNSLK